MALRDGFGPGPWVSSTKPLTGHLLGASSAVEIGLALLAMRHGWAPATLNLEYLDPKCPIRPVPAPGVAANLKAGASVSVGFGGQVGVVLATQPEETP